MMRTGRVSEWECSEQVESGTGSEWVEKERQREYTDNDSDERQSEGDSISATSVNGEILRGKPSISNVRKLNPIGTYWKIICE